MRLIAVFFLLCLNTSFAQQKSIDFNKDLSWSQIKAMAKKEKKYIFLDGYTTWCVPCKEMERSIFPNPEVVDFFNSNFINISVQFDVTKDDSKEIKVRYEDAKNLKEAYEVNSYPTYLFFNPEGFLVHKIIGASSSAKEFILKAKLALDPKTQYASLKVRFDKGERDTLFLRSLIETSLSSDLNSLPIYANVYLPKLKKSDYKNNLKLIYYGTNKTSDFSFKLIQEFSKEIDSFYGIRSSQKTINRLVFEEFVFPHLRINGTIRKNGFMIFYDGEIISKVNWPEIELLVEKLYPQDKAEILRYSKEQYFTWTLNWSEYSGMVKKYIEDYSNKVNGDELSDYANTIFKNCNDSLILKDAMDWIKLTKSLDKGNSLKSQHINARLNYKIGDKEIAIKEMEEVVKLSGQLSWLVDELNKMKRGDKTW